MEVFCTTGAEFSDIAATCQESVILVCSADSSISDNGIVFFSGLVVLTETILDSIGKMKLKPTLS